MLGIIIGVVSVVVLLAIGNGTQQDIVNQIESLGTNLLTITPGARSRNVRAG
jgi:ABC-type antimicrobial peptide transport system permease subunit